MGFIRTLLNATLCSAHSPLPSSPGTLWTQAGIAFLLCLNKLCLQHRKIRIVQQTQAFVAGIAPCGSWPEQALEIGVCLWPRLAELPPPWLHERQGVSPACQQLVSMTRAMWLEQGTPENERGSVSQPHTAAQPLRWERKVLGILRCPGHIAATGAISQALARCLAPLLAGKQG